MTSEEETQSHRHLSLYDPRLFDTSEWRECPRCHQLFRWKDEYVDHAWNEKP